MLFGPALAVAALATVSACSRIPSQISNSSAGAYEAALAVHADGLAAAWYDTRHGNAEIYFRLLDPDGRPAGPERRLTNGPEESYEASIEPLGGGLVVAWYDKAADGSLVAKIGAWNRDGGNRWVRPLSESASRNPIVRSRGRAIFCAWIQADPDGGESVWSGWWDADGRPLDGQRRLAPAGRTTWNLGAAVDRSGTAHVVFDATASTRADELFIVAADGSSRPPRRLTADDGVPSKYPDLALRNGRAALSWHDERDGNREIYLHVSSLDELNGELGQRARRVTNTAGESIGAYLAWNGDRLGLAWSDETEGVAGEHEIYFQHFDRNGRSGAPALRLTANSTASLIPAIRAWKNGFALAWNEFAPTAAEGHGGRSQIAFALIR